MAIEIISTLFTPVLLPAETGDFLIGNHLEKIKVEITFKIEIYALATVDNTILFFPTVAQGYVETDHVVSDDPVFKDFNVGDTYKWLISGTLSDYGTIIAKISDYDIRITTHSGTYGYHIGNDDQIYVTTPITALRYYWNLIENGEQNNYFSKIDGSEQQAIIQYKLASDTTSDTLVNQGSPCYQIGDITINGVSVNTSKPFEQKYKITHNLFIPSFPTESEYQDYIAHIAPAYLLNGNSLKYIYKIIALPQFTDPNRKQSVEITNVLGNTGWQTENYNNNPTQYSVDSVVYKDYTGAVITNLELTTNNQTVEIIIGNSFSPFLASNTHFVLQFHRTPDDDTTYIGNGRTMDVNFMFDYVNAIAAINTGNTGSNYGTPRQVITAVSSTVTFSGGRLTITATIALGADIIDEMVAANRMSYSLSCSTVTYNDTLNSDRVCLLVDNNLFTINQSDPNLIKFGGIARGSNFFFRAWEDETMSGILDINAYPEDEIVAYTQLKLDRTLCPPTTDSVLVKNITCKLIAKNTSTGANFILESYTQSFQGLPIINDQEDITAKIPRQFQIPVAEIRKNIQFISRQDLQTAHLYYFDIYYPFMMRWEYWEVLGGVDNVFYNSAQDLNGFNQFWHHYSTMSNWVISYECDVVVSKNGNILTNSMQKQIFSSDWNAVKTQEPTAGTIDNHWQDDVAPTIKTYSSVPLTSGVLINGKSYIIETLNGADNFTTSGFAATGDSFVYNGTPPITWASGTQVFKMLFDGYVNNYIEDNEDVIVDVRFTNKSFAAVANENHIWIGMEVFEEGGIAGLFHLTSQWARPGGLLKSIDQINHTDIVVKYVSGTNEMRGKCLIDYTLLPNKAKFMLSARLYHFKAGDDTKLNEGGVVKMTEDNFIKIIE